MTATERARRAERLQTIAVEMDRIVKEIGPAWIRLTHLRAEARTILEELSAAPRP